MKNVCMIIFMFMVCVTGYADDAVVQMDFLDKILAFLNGLSGPALVGAGAVLEIVLRLVKSEKPLSILHLVGGMAKKLGGLLMKIGDIMDKVLPQRLK